MSKKFGAKPESAIKLLEKALLLELNVVGITFHVGTQVFNSDMHVYAIQKALEVIEQAKTLGVNISHLDIGGGFPVDYDNLAGELDIYDFCSPIREALK